VKGNARKGSTNADDDDTDELTDAERVALDAVPCCVWRTTPEVLKALLDRLGDPVDSYVNGSQVWIDDDGPNGIGVEWRLHPVAGYVRPEGHTTSGVFADVATGAADVDPVLLWDGLEAFPAYHDEITPEDLQSWASTRLGIGPDGFGRANHDAIADRWERSGRQTSIVHELIAELLR
jgi:hypothetical protein